MKETCSIRDVRNRNVGLTISTPTSFLSFYFCRSSNSADIKHVNTWVNVRQNRMPEVGREDKRQRSCGWLVFRAQPALRPERQIELESVWLTVLTNHTTWPPYPSYRTDNWFEVKDWVLQVLLQVNMLVVVIRKRYVSSVCENLLII